MAGWPQAVYCMDDDSYKTEPERGGEGWENKQIGQKIRIGNTEGKFHFNLDIYQKKTSRLNNFYTILISKIHPFKTMAPAA